MSLCPRIGPRRRRGFTYLELQIALAILGITMAGLCPIIVSQLRLAEQVERQVYCLVPSDTLVEAVDDVTALTPGAGASPRGRLLRRLGFPNCGMTLVPVSLSRDRELGRWRGLRLNSLDGSASWTLAIDLQAPADPFDAEPDPFTPVGPAWTRGLGDYVTPAPLTTEPGDSRVRIESQQPGQWTILKAP